MLSWPFSGLLSNAAVIWHGMAVKHAVKLSVGNGPYLWQLLRHNQKCSERVLTCFRWNYDRDFWNTLNIHMHIKATTKKIVPILAVFNLLIWTWQNRFDAYDTELYCPLIPNWTLQPRIFLKDRCQKGRSVKYLRKLTALKKEMLERGASSPDDRKKCSFTVVGLFHIASS